MQKKKNQQTRDLVKNMLNNSPLNIPITEAKTIKMEFEPVPVKTEFIIWEVLLQIICHSGKGASGEE